MDANSCLFWRIAYDEADMRIDDLLKEEEERKSTINVMTYEE